MCQAEYKWDLYHYNGKTRLYTISNWIMRKPGNELASTPTTFSTLRFAFLFSFIFFLSPSSVLLIQFPLPATETLLDSCNNRTQNQPTESSFYYSHTFIFFFFCLLPLSNKLPFLSQPPAALKVLPEVWVPYNYLNNNDNIAYLTLHYPTGIKYNSWGTYIVRFAAFIFWFYIFIYFFFCMHILLLYAHIRCVICFISF